MATRFQQRRDTAANWADVNPILRSGELGFETDGDKNVKLGDGESEWNDLEPLTKSVAAVLEDAAAAAGLRFQEYPVLDGEVGVEDVTKPYEDVTRYGAVADGVTDNTTAVRNAIVSRMALNGGTLVFPLVTGKYRWDGQIVIPNSGGSTPTQPSLRITGRGAGTAAGQTGTPRGGAQLDLRYAGAGAKIVTLGLGTLELDHLTLLDNGESTTPFLLTTLTTVKVHDNRFNGNPDKSGVTCDQDAIILGGTSTSITGTVDDPFQGYGSVIRENTFSRIRRATYHRVYCNNVVVRDNWLLHDCGSNLPTGAAFDVDGGAGSSASGNMFAGNTIESGSYPYPIRWANSVHNCSMYNGFYDESDSNPLAFHRIEATSGFNLILMGLGSDAIPTVLDLGDPVSTTLVTTHQGQPSLFPQGMDLGGIVRLLNGESARIVDPDSGDYWLDVLSGGNQVDRQYKPSASAVESYWSQQRVNATIRLLQLHGLEFRVLADGKMQILAGAGAELWLGSDEVAAWIVTATGRLQYIGADPVPFTLGAARPTVAGNWLVDPAGTADALAAALSTIGLIADTTVNSPPVRRIDFGDTPYTVPAIEKNIFVSTAGGAVTVNLPANPADGRVINIKKITTDANVLTIARNGKLIENAAANYTTAASTLPSITLQYDATGGTWWIL